MQNQHVYYVNQPYIWPFSIAILVCQRVECWYNMCINQLCGQDVTSRKSSREGESIRNRRAPDVLYVFFKIGLRPLAFKLPSSPNNSVSLGYVKSSSLLVWDYLGSPAKNSSFFVGCLRLARWNSSDSLLIQSDTAEFP